MLEQADLDALVALVDACQRSADPLIFLPSDKHPAEAVLCRVNADSLEVDDWTEFQADDLADRVLSTRLALAGVMT